MTSDTDLRSSYTMDDCMITSDTSTHLCCKLSPSSDRLRACESHPVLRTKLRPNSYSEQIQCSREEGDKGAKGYLLAKVADTPLSMKDGSDPLEVDCTPPIHMDGDTTWSLKWISPDLKDQSVNSEGAKSKDTNSYNQDG